MQDPKQPAERRVVVERPAQVGSLVIAWHVPNLRSQDSYVLEVIKAILAEGKKSRSMTAWCAEKRSYSNLRLTTNMPTMDPSLFYLTVSVLPGKDFGEIEKAIYEEMELLKNTPVGTRELEKAKNQLEAAFVFDQESIFSLAPEPGFIRNSP